MKRVPASLVLSQSEPSKARKGSKYGNVKTVVDGITFSSKKEATRYGQLKILERSGRIFDLKLQPRFGLLVQGKKVCTYVGDFQYVTPEGRAVVEDAKGFRTAEYRLKAKLFEACLGFPITEV